MCGVWMNECMSAYKGAMVQGVYDLCILGFVVGATIYGAQNVMYRIAM